MHGLGCKFTTQIILLKFYCIVWIWNVQFEIKKFALKLEHIFHIKSTKQSFFLEMKIAQVFVKWRVLVYFKSVENHYYLTHRNKQTFCRSSTLAKIMSSSHFQMMVIVLTFAIHGKVICSVWKMLSKDCYFVSISSFSSTMKFYLYICIFWLFSTFFLFVVRQ